MILINNFLLPVYTAIVLAVYWFEFANIPARLPWLPAKPFRCELCLSAWFGGIFSGFAIYVRGALPFLEIIAAMFTAGVITPMLIKWIQKLMQ